MSVWRVVEAEVESSTPEKVAPPAGKIIDNGNKWNRGNSVPGGSAAIIAAATGVNIHSSSNNNNSNNNSVQNSSSVNKISGKSENSRRSGDRNGNHREGGDRSSRRNNGRRRGGGGGGVNKQIDNEQKEYFTQMAIQQIELLFTIDNLCMDTFLRAYMDLEGYVPLGFVMCYQNVSYCGADFQDVLNALQSKDDKYLLQLDTETGTIRVREGWEKWLMPNAATPGGKGMPRYTKAQYEASMNQQTTFNEPTKSNTKIEETRIEPTGIHLSAKATEFKMPGKK